MHDLSEWLRERARAHAMSVEGITRSECRRWVSGENGVDRDDGRFMGLAYLRVRTNGREVAEWDQIALIERDAPGTLGTVVLVARDNGDVLVRAIAEPCNVGIEVDGVSTHTLFGPSIQYSGHNRIAHAQDGADDAGRAASPTPLIGFFENPDVSDRILWQRAAGSGGRHRQVIQLGLLIVVPDDVHLRGELDQAVAGNKDAQDFRWVTRDELREIYYAGLANHHLRSCSSLLL